MVDGHGDSFSSPTIPFNLTHPPTLISKPNKAYNSKSPYPGTAPTVPQLGEGIVVFFLPQPNSAKRFLKDL